MFKIIKLVERCCVVEEIEHVKPITMYVASRNQKFLLILKQIFFRYSTKSLNVFLLLHNNVYHIFKSLATIKCVAHIYEKG